MTVDQGGLSIERVIRINISNVNESPTDILLNGLSIAENLPFGSLVGSFDAIDEDTDDLFAFAFVSGSGDDSNHLFLIENSELRTAETFDYERMPHQSIRVVVSDSSGAIFEQEFAIAVLDVDEFIREDVNADTVVSPIDALLVINHLNSTGGTLGSNSNPRLDVNGDRIVSPTDVLLVINYLNSNSNSNGEGEFEISPWQRPLETGEETTFPAPPPSFDFWFAEQVTDWDNRKKRTHSSGQKI